MAPLPYTHRKRSTRLVYPLLFGLIFIAVSGASVLTASPTPSPSPLNMADQISGDVKHALAENARAHTYKEWKQGGFTPREIFKNVAAMNSKEGFAALCTALKSLKTEDLVMFQPSLEEETGAQSLACRNTLLQQLKNKPLETPVFSAENIDPKNFKGEVVTLSFEGGPSQEHTPAILDILDTAHVSAQFFLDWKKVNQAADLSRSIRKRGHVVGSLPITQLSAVEMPEKDAQNLLSQNQDRVSAIAESHSVLVRLPYGESNPRLLDFLKAKGWQNSPWTIDSEDWKTRSPNELVQNILRKVTEAHGGVVLLHDSLPQTQAALPSIIQSLKAHGYVLK